MNFKQCVRILNQTLREKNPSEFSSTWIVQYAPSAYRYIFKNVRTEIGQIDWDRVTMALIRRYQHCWIRYQYKPREEYENQIELEKVLGKYRGKLYVFIALSNDKEERLRHRITIALARVAQKGNVLAMKELVGHLRYIVDEWIDRYFSYAAGEEPRAKLTV